MLAKLGLVKHLDLSKSMVVRTWSMVPKEGCLLGLKVEEKSLGQRKVRLAKLPEEGSLLLLLVVGFCMREALKVAKVLAVGGAEHEVERFGLGRGGERVRVLVGEEEESCYEGESVKHR